MVNLMQNISGFVFLTVPPPPFVYSYYHLHRTPHLDHQSNFQPKMLGATTRLSSALHPNSILSRFSLSSSSLKPLSLRRHRFFNHYHLRSHSSSIKMSTTQQVVEHIVLFKVKPDAEPTKVNAMVNNLNCLSSLNLTLHLTAGPLLRNRSTSLSFTHILHSRYASKSDLAAYTVHPGHVSVVTNFVRPVVDDIMAVDWVNSNPLTGEEVVINPNSAMRVSFLKLKEGLGEEEKTRILGIIGGIKDVVNCIDQVSYGENFSLDRAKGYSIASIGIYGGGLAELEALDSEKEKVRDLIESVVVVDYVVPLPSQATSNL